MAERYFEPERSRYADEERYREHERRAPRYGERDYDRGWWGERDWGRGYGERDWGSGYGASERERGREFGAPSRDRSWARDWDRSSGRGYRGEERGFFDRFGDEVRSWFGDEEAQRRRMMDERDESRERGGDWRWPRSASERRWWDNDSEVPRQWGYVDRSDVGRQDWNRERFAPGTTGREMTGREQYGSGTAGTSYYGQTGMFGEHVGRGPRGWQRSDKRIREDICERMSQHGQLDASDIEVRVNNCEVTLEGNVPDRHAKRLAEELTESGSGVRDVHNQIRVGAQEGQQQQRGFGEQRRIA